MPDDMCPYCGHEWRRHDPEDGRCDAHSAEQGVFGPCRCGRDVTFTAAANARLSRTALDRLRDARGDDEVQRLRAINAELVEAHNTLLVEAARSPQGEGHEAGDFDALSLPQRMRLLADQADEEHIRGWADEIERLSPSRDGTVAVEALRSLYDYCNHLGIKNAVMRTAHDALAEFSPASTGEQTDHGGDQ